MSKSGQRVPSQPMTVLFVDHTAKLGGGELALAAMLRHLDRAQVRPKVLLFEDGPFADLLRACTEVQILPLSDTIREARKEGLSGVNFGQVRSVGSLILYVFKLRRLIRQLEVDLVHTNSLKSDILAGLGGLLAGKRVVWHVRDRIATDYLPPLAVRVFRKLVRIIPFAVIANSQATMDSLCLAPRTVPKARPRLASVIHDGLDFGRLPGDVDQAAERQLVGLVGRISPWKGQDVFLRAISLIHAEFPAVQFQIIGSALFGEEEFAASLRALCTSLGLDSCVEFTGFVSDVAERIAQLTVLVHASTLAEPFGQVIIEGMAAGKPVIASKGGGASEIVIDGDCGLLVPPSDPTALASALRSLLSDSQLRERLGAAGRNRVSQHFRIESTAEKVLQLYRQIDAEGRVAAG